MTKNIMNKTDKTKVFKNEMSKKNLDVKESIFLKYEKTQ